MSRRARVFAAVWGFLALPASGPPLIGRERYARAGGGAAIYRNGYEARSVKTTSGPLELERPRIRSVTELEFESQVLGKPSPARTRWRR